MLFSSFCKNIQIAKQMPEETGLHSGCKHASNPYHVCSEYCFDFVADPKKLAAIKDPASVKGEKTGVNPDCRHSLNPYHVCSEYCSDVISEPKKLAAKTEPAGLKAETRNSQPTSISISTAASVEAEITGVNRDCKHSSNPYHVCSEYCFEEPKKSTAKNEPAGIKAETRNSQPTSISTAASVEAEITGINRDCKYSSNPYHVCSEYCFEVVSEPKKSTAKNEPASVEAEKTGVQRGCRHSSNPYHNCSEYCFEIISEPNKTAAKNEPASVEAEKTGGANRDCRHSSNPYHVCSEYCFEVISETKKSAAKTEPAGLKAETRNAQPASVEGEKTGVNRDCRYSSNPYHVCSEFCFEEPKKSTAKNEPGETRGSQPTSISSVEAEEKGVNRNCRYSSNPYHVCSEFCFEATSEPKKSTAKNEPGEKTGVNRDCRHSSNPYHICSEYCFEEPKKSTAKNEPVGLKAETGSSQSSSISSASSVEGEKTGVNRDCRYSSNPYHICSEFCFQVIAEPKKSKAKNVVGRRHFRKGRKSVDNGRLISV